MFERFTDRARRVVVLAQEEARLLNHNYIGTEHLLLGLIREGEGVAARALESLGVSLARTRAEVDAIIGHGSEAPSGHIPFTPRSKKVLELSLREAMQLGHNYIGTEHILLGMIREGQGVAAQVLVKQGVGLDAARQAVITLVSGGTIESVTDPFADPADRPGAGGGFVRVVRSTPASATPGAVSGFGIQPGGARARCSFCLRAVDHVERYVRGRDALICDVCVGRAQELVAGAGERGPKRLRLPPPFLPQLQTPEAEAEVVHAFETVFGNDAGVDARLGLIEGSGPLRDVVTQMVAVARQFGNPDIWVDMVRFIAHGEAAVDSSALLGGGNRFPMHGDAVLDGGIWKVSRATYERVASMAGVQVPPEPDEPEPGDPEPGKEPPGA